MKSEQYTNAVLTLIAVMLSIGVLRPVLIREMTTPSGSKIVWEYKVFYRQRGFKVDRQKLEEIGEANEWLTESDDPKKLAKIDVDVKIAQLGAEGWELVTVEPRSDHAGVNLQGVTGDLAILGGFAANGATSSDLWVFKRHKY